MAYIEIDGRRVGVSVLSCTLHLIGEFGGNLDMELRADGDIPERDLLDNLRLRLEPGAKPVSVLGMAQAAGGWDVTFETGLSDGELIPDMRVPRDVDVIWLSEDATRAITSVPVATVHEPDDVGQGESASAQPGAPQSHAAVKSGCALLVALAVVAGTGLSVVASL